MSESQPLVSVIIPAYNMADLTALTVQSILDQTYSNVEVIVVDDGSKDATEERMREFGDQIIYIRKENGGACSARNLGIKNAKGKYIGLIDCDDLYMPEKIEKCVQFLKANPDYGMVHNDAYFIDGEGNIIRRSSHPKAKISGWIKNCMILTNFICNGSVILRKECFDKVGLFDEELFPPADWDMWIRVSEKYKVKFLNEPLNKYRVSSSGCFNDMERTMRETQIVIDRFFERNPNASSLLKRRAYSRFHWSNMLYYFAKDDVANMKDEHKKALAQFPLNIKAIVFFFYYLMAKESLKKKVEKIYFLS